MLRIKDIKNSQYFYGKGRSGKFYEFKAWGDPFLDEDGEWCVEASDSGDYGYTFSVDEEAHLYAECEGELAE